MSTRRGEQSPLWHERRGIVGCLQDWAEGSRARAAEIVVKLIKTLGLQASRDGAPPPYMRT